MDTALDILLNNARSINAHTGKIYGVVPARVFAVHDDSPEKRHLRGMVQVWFPFLQDKDDKDLIKPWARMSMPAGGRGYVGNQKPNAFDNHPGDGCGFYTPPTVGDEVLCGFEQGDIHFPYIIGTLWNGVDKIPGVSDVTGRYSIHESVRGPGSNCPGGMSARLDSDAGGNSHAVLTDPSLKDKEKVGPKTGPQANRLWYWRSRSGHLIIFDDTTDKPKVIITTAGGRERVVLDQKAHKVQIVSGYSPCKLTSMHTPEYKPHTCVPVEPLDGDGALGDQNSGSGDNVNGGDIELIAKNRLWMKARKINMISSHNTNCDAGNLFRVHARGALTLEAGYNLSLIVHRALIFDVGMPPLCEALPPQCAPAVPKGAGKVGQWLVKCSGGIEITSLGVPTVGTKDIKISCFPLGSLEIKLFKDYKLMLMTGGQQIMTMLGNIDIISPCGDINILAPAGKIFSLSNQFIRITCGPIIDIAGGVQIQLSGAVLICMAPLILLN